MVHLTTYLSPARIHLDVPGADKHELLRTVAECLAPTVDGLDAGQIASLLLARERLASTGVGDGVAIPHASTPELKEPCVALLRPARPVPFDAVDNQPVTLLLVVLAPHDAQALHLRLLARIARLVRSVQVRERLLAVQSAEEAYSYIGSIEGSE